MSSTKEILTLRDLKKKGLVLATPFISPSYIERSGTAEENMAFDRHLLETADQLTLHIYSWKVHCATYGLFVKPEEVFHPGVEVAKRPTGGGVIFHGYDFTFSLFIPADHALYSTNTLQNYFTINSLVRDACRVKLDLMHEGTMGSPKYCFANPSPFDLMLEGKKVGGAAQRRTRRGLLHQSSLFLQMPPRAWVEKVLVDTSEVDAMYQASSSIKVDSLKNGLLAAFGIQ